MYTLELDAVELSALQWIAGRYNYASVLYDALELANANPGRFAIAEHEAWEFAAAVEAEDGLLSCAGDTLADKLIELLNSIV